MLVNHEFSGLLLGLTVKTRPGGRLPGAHGVDGVRRPKIVEAFVGAGVPVDEFIVAGGLAKNPLLMQFYADVLRLPLSLIGSEQGPALGSAIHAASPPAPTRTSRLVRGDGQLEPGRVRPIAATADRYDELFAEYTTLTTTSVAAATT